MEPQSIAWEDDGILITCNNCQNKWKVFLISPIAGIFEWQTICPKCNISASGKIWKIRGEKD